jgi:uncharacterized protein YeeX (DUF496 family)
MDCSALVHVRVFVVDLQVRLAANEDERHVLLERSATHESKIDRLVRENAEIAKKRSELESALQELARQHQGLQVRECFHIIC